MTQKGATPPDEGSARTTAHLFVRGPEGAPQMWAMFRRAGPGAKGPWMFAGFASSTEELGRVATRVKCEQGQGAFYSAMMPHEAVPATCHDDALPRAPISCGQMTLDQMIQQAHQ